MRFLKPISISLSPNTEKDDIWLALKLLFSAFAPLLTGLRRIRRSSLSVSGGGQPWRDGPAIKELEEEFKKYLGVKHATSFNSGRSALLAILNGLEIKSDDEILLQGFTCNSAIVPILKQKAKPVFVDIDETINMAPEDLRRKITKKSKAVMVQHNFGWPAQLEKISKIARENNLYLIEDCAHALGAEYRSRKAGTFGDAAFFSFGRDKIISSVFGGMAVTNNEKIGECFKSFQEKLDFPSNFWILQQLLHPILINYLILPIFGLNQYSGRILLGLFHKLSILSKAVSKKEKRGESLKCFPKKFPNALAILAKNQFRKLENFNQHRREIANFYERELTNTNFILSFARPQESIIPTFLRYPILTRKNTDEILREARKRKIYLDDGWRKTPIVPLDTVLTKMQYNLGSCPRAEELAKNIINLPTHINISQKEAKKIAEFIKKYAQ